jgi:calcium-dependent protein kinase
MKVFQDFDKNGDGVLEREELIQGYISLGKTKKQACVIVDDIMNKVDVNKNGTIDYSEFLMANFNQEEAVSKSKLKQTFKLFDKVMLLRNYLGWRWTNNS